MPSKPGTRKGVANRIALTSLNLLRSKYVVATDAAGLLEARFARGAGEIIMRNQAIRILCACTLANAAMAADYVAININTDPDVLVQFDTAVPSAATTVVATLAGNFVRGLDLTSDNDGWYIVTTGATVNGLYQLVDGASTLVAALPFTTTAVGGLTLNADNSALWVALDPPDARPDTLFSVSFTGVFTEVGPITDAATPEIAALALHPTTGALYAIDNASNVLLQIDTASGAGTRIGTGLGVAASAVGGADFSKDGTNTLYIATDGGRVYAVDTQTGLAGPLLGRLPFATSSIAALPQAAACPGDLNGDRSVNESDLGLLLQSWQSGPGGDADGDGDTDESDLGILLQNWQVTCP